MEALTEDTLLNGKVIIQQPKDGFRATSDSVFLASAINAGTNDRILDLGCGSGSASLCLANRVGDTKIVGLEIDRDLARLAQDNAVLNGFERRFESIVGDLVKPLPRIAPHSFDHIMANPPYYEIGKTTPPRQSTRLRAHSDSQVNLSSWVSFAFRMAKHGGTITFIQRTERLTDMLKYLSARSGQITVFPLWSHDPFIDRSKGAKRVIIQAKMGSDAELKLHGGLILHNPDGTFTKETEKILRKGDALDLLGSK